MVSKAAVKSRRVRQVTSWTDSDDSSFVDVDEVPSLQNECGIGNCSEFAPVQPFAKTHGSPRALVRPFAKTHTCAGAPVCI